MEKSGRTLTRKLSLEFKWTIHRPNIFTIKIYIDWTIINIKIILYGWSILVKRAFNQKRNTMVTVSTPHLSRSKRQENFWGRHAINK